MYVAAATRVARHSAPALRRRLATAAVSPTAPPASSGVSSPIPLSNVEARWTTLTPEEKASVHNQLEELQKKDWKQLTIDEKKAAYYVAFGPHGPRAPYSQPGDNLKILLGTTGLLAIAASLFFGLKQFVPPPPKTMNKEWQEATNERAREMKLNPISGISSEDYKGKGFVQ